MTEFYTSKRPLVGKSKLTRKEAGGIGKDLSDGYTINMAIGCTHGCPFCYVDEIIERFHRKRFNITAPWGEYILIRKGIQEMAARTNWEKYRGKEVLMSSTHDPYLPCLQVDTREVLRHALPHGVRFRIQTRHVGFLQDQELFNAYPDQVQVQVSLSTWNLALWRVVEPRIVSPYDRIKALASVEGVKKGFILAPLIPACDVRCHPFFDLDLLVEDIRKAMAPKDIEHIYGEALHVRGKNLPRMNALLGASWTREDLLAFDEEMEEFFNGYLKGRQLPHTYWREHR